MPFNHQLPSPFFTTPTEIRHAIYAHLAPDQIHISCCQTGLRLSPCIQRDGDGEAHDNNKRATEDDRIGSIHLLSPPYLRRLQSSWGAHWRCEEALLQASDDGKMKTGLAPLFVCKRMFVDFASAIVDFTTVQACDLNTLGRLTAGNMPEYDRSLTCILSNHILPNIKTLGISLRLPLVAYQALEAPKSLGSSHTDPEIAFFESSHSNLSAWTKLPRTVHYLPKLSKIHLWLDHSDTISWSLVNERSILTPLMSLQNIRLSINLPRLHPKYESPTRHFFDNSPTSAVTIERRMRQRHFAVEDRNGKLMQGYHPDFPFLFEVPEYLSENEKVFGRDPFDEEQLAELTMEWEQKERDMILRGEDPRRALDQFDNIVCTVGYL